MSKITSDQLDELRWRLEDKIQKIKGEDGDYEARRLTELTLLLLSELVEVQLAKDRYTNTRFP